MNKIYFRTYAIAAFMAIAGISMVGCSKSSNPTNNTPSSITVLTPPAGVVLVGGTQNYQITWSGAGIATPISLEYSLDNGSTWTPIGSLSTNVTSYNWNVPNIASTKAIVRITDHNGLSASSGIFSISFSNTLPTLLVTAPAANEVVTGGSQNYQITWSGTGIATQKTLEYSLDNGATWSQIAVVNSASLSYGWTVPNTASSKAIVRITDKNGLTASSGVFTITATSGLAIGEMDADISGVSFKVLNAKKTALSQLAFSIKGSLEKYNNATFDSVSLTLVIPVQGGLPYTVNAATDDNTQITFCIVNPISGTCATSYTAKKGTGSGTITITSLTPIVEGTFTGTLLSGTNSMTITNGAFKAQFN